MPNVDVGKYLECKCISQENAFQGKELASNNSSRSNNIHISMVLARYHVNAHDYNYTNAHRFHKDIEGRADGLFPGGVQ